MQHVFKMQYIYLLPKYMQLILGVSFYVHSHPW
jgi:hypothetical protein